MRRLLLTCALLTSLFTCGCGRPDVPGLPLRSTAPDFSLPGADGRQHSLGDYADRQILALVLTANTCPAAQLYERRIQRLHQEYRDRGVAVIAVNANRPDALHLADLAYSDGGETLDDMTARVNHRGLTYPYLSDGESQSLTKALGAVSLPHVFVFDRARVLQYSGRLDDDLREDRVTSSDARDAIEALLAGRAVPRGRPVQPGCEVRGLSPREPDAALARFQAAPVPLEMAGAEALTRLRQNGTGKLLLINFWATWCAPCASEFPDLEETYRRYHARGLEYVTVSVNDPGEREGVERFLREHHASHDNRLFATSDVYGLQAAFDPNMPAPVPFTLLLAPNGDVLYQHLGEVDFRALRRAILAHLPDDPRYPGLQARWQP